MDVLLVQASLLTVVEGAGIEGVEILVNPVLPEPEGRAALQPDNRAPYLVIFTSGTTGLPKGVVCSQLKLAGAGWLTRVRIGLRAADRGYLAMPLFHSNAWFLGIMPMLAAGGSVVLRRKFSASGFIDDALEHGVTYLNYVGQPIHYILDALEARYGEDVEALASDPRNKLRIAHGNGATAIDREKMVRYLGMEHIYELYGSTEAAINTLVNPGDPPDSVGRISNFGVVILDGEGNRCPLGRVDHQGRLINYDVAVGEICRKVDRDNIFFDGYYGDEEATASKYRDGYFHSGDLGHIRVRGFRRYLYFNGRTHDWIRKDGENFSAATVAEFAMKLPWVSLACAYGVPAEVADEKVMVALQLVAGVDFDPHAAFTDFRELTESGGMDPKWFPDFVRVIDELEVTETQKIRVRAYKRRHFQIGTEAVWFRERGDVCYRSLTADEYERLCGKYAGNGRLGLLLVEDDMDHRSPHLPR
jgi:fatty-acyl-CoA synthase